MHTSLYVFPLFALVSCGHNDSFEYKNHSEFQSVYQNIDDVVQQCGKKQTCLKRGLTRLAFKGKRKLSYRSARYAMFQNIDAKYVNGRKVVYGVYSSKPFKLRNSGIPDHNKFNCEHTWPQSRFTVNHRKGHSPKSDLVHLFPTFNRLNSQRGNKPFGEIKGLNPTEIQISHTKADPPEKHKGIVARAMFYMSVAYSMNIDAKQEKVLRRWHQKYPVTDSERKRADKIFEAQGNWNPFIVKPSLVSRISDF